MAQRLARLHPSPKFARSIPRRPFKLPLNVSRLLLSLLKYVEANLMNPGIKFVLSIDELNVLTIKLVQ